MKDALDNDSGTGEPSKTYKAVIVFVGVLLLLALIVCVPIRYFFGIDYFKVLAVALALATLLSLFSVDAWWSAYPLAMMMLGLIAAVLVWLVFSTGFFTVLAVSLVLGILIPLLMGEELREVARTSYEQTRKKGREAREREAREREEQRQLEARVREARQRGARQREALREARQREALRDPAPERLREQKERFYRPERQDGGGERTVPFSLHELRNMPYKDYLQTPHWKRLREDKLRAAGRRCQICSSDSVTLNVHHNNYKNRGKELDRDLIVLCRGCHSLFHEHGRLSR